MVRNSLQKVVLLNFLLARNRFRTNYNATFLWDSSGIEYRIDTDGDLLNKLIDRFGQSFPKTVVFSEFARSLVTDCNPIEDPDNTLAEWYSMEERLFYIYEKHLIQDRVEKGFVHNGVIDVDDFIKYSLSVQNRRKSRAGLSLENHVCALLDANHILYAHGKYHCCPTTFQNSAS